jgi:hypothetical protein
MLFQRGPLSLHLGRPLHALPLEIDAFLVELLLLFAQLLLAGIELAAAISDFEFQLLPLLGDFTIPEFLRSLMGLFGGGFFVSLLQLPKRLGMRKRGRLAIELLSPLPELQVEGFEFIFAQRDLVHPFVEGLHLLFAAADFRRAMLQVLNLSAEFPFPLLKVVLPFALPQAGGTKVRFELRDPRIELRFAAIDFSQTGFQMSCKLRSLQLELFLAESENLERTGGGFGEGFGFRPCSGEGGDDLRQIGCVRRFCYGKRMSAIDPQRRNGLHGFRRALFGFLLRSFAGTGFRHVVVLRQEQRLEFSGR